MFSWNENENSPNNSRPELHVVIATKEDFWLAYIFTRKNIVFLHVKIYGFAFLSGRNPWKTLMFI